LAVKEITAVQDIRHFKVQVVAVLALLAVMLRQELVVQVVRVLQTALLDQA
jgi:hypothetical protein